MAEFRVEFKDQILNEGRARMTVESIVIDADEDVMIANGFVCFYRSGKPHAFLAADEIAAVVRKY